MSKPLANVVDEVAHHRFTSDEYYRLVELGFFEGRRVELIQGEIIAMPPMGSPHATTLTLALQGLQRLFTEGYVVRVQMPLHLEARVLLLLGEIQQFAAESSGFFELATVEVEAGKAAQHRE